MDQNNDRIKYGKLSGDIGIFCNVFLAAAKITIGIMSGMVSIMADGINNLSDAISSIVSLIGFKLSSMPADDDHPFGHARFEYISGLVVAFLVMLAGVELLQSSAEKIFHPSEVDYSLIMFIVLIISIIVKALMAIINYRLGHKISSTVILATAADSRNDVISTSAVLISAIISYITGINLDGIMGCAVAVFILISGICLVRDTIEPLLGSAPDPELVNEIEAFIMSYEGVLGTHDLMVHDYGPGHRFASVHVEVPAERSVLECHELIDLMEHDINEKMGLSLVIHYDPIVTSDAAVSKIREYMKAQAKQLDASLSIHDLRIVPGENNTNVIFDCVVPHSCPISEDTIRKELADRLALEYPYHTAVIKFDHSFVSLS